MQTTTALLLPLLAFAAQDPAADTVGLSAEQRMAARLTPEARVVQEVAPAVVYIESSRPFWAGFDAFGRRVWQLRMVSGSGVVLDRSGYIVTNYHVVGHDAKKITVQFDPEIDPKLYTAELKSYVASEDLALLKIEGEREFPVVRRGTSSDLMIGERVLAIGNPFRQKLTVSAGIISGLHRNLTMAGSPQPLSFNDLIQTDASINPGNSGGPLLNILGELVGINTALNTGAENMGFAIPVDRVEEVLRDHLWPSASHAWLGFEVDESGGFCVTRVVAGGPAAEADLQEGDRVVAVDGAALRSPEDFRRRRADLEPGQPVLLRVRSSDPRGSEREIELRGWGRADGTLFERLGMTVEAHGSLTEAWVRVERLALDGPAWSEGLRRGDLIDAVRIHPGGPAWMIQTAESFASLVSSLEPGTRLLADVLRDLDGDGHPSPAELHKCSLRLR
ncbi:MAG TPA: trypsin-like peptidase domain-containing protein [Planctomycetota bacterium]|nr:trypsin-like peptidase domain-containing protein [Planctomycetota bacterium]